jgi:predicted enzyme related to lactoylglutathione lyase
MVGVDNYPHGVPCWVDSWQPDPAAAAGFYAELFGWQLDRVWAGSDAGYVNASLGGRLVAGIGQAPVGAPAVWALNIRVDAIEPTILTVVAAGGRQLVGALAVGEQGRVAVVADSTGVPFALWEPGLRQGAQLIGVPDTWAMSALHTTAIGEAERFYGSVFGWELVPIPNAGLCEWRLGGERIAVATLTDGRAVPAHWAINFAVADADAFTENAQTLGATVLMAPMDTPGLRSAVLADPQGAVFAVSASRP